MPLAQHDALWCRRKVARFSLVSMLAVVVAAALVVTGTQKVDDLNEAQSPSGRSMRASR